MKLAIIGGGPSGLMAAIKAKKELNDLSEVHVYEKNDRIGKKILASGNGHCNFSNQLSAPNYYNHPEFVQQVFDICSPQQTNRMFLDLGLEQKIDEEGRMYPLSDMASSVLDVLRFECEHIGVQIHVEKEIQSIEKKPHGFLLHFGKDTFFADVVIISTGGKAAPHLGTQGQAYSWIQTLGHHITPTFPSIGPIKVHPESIRGLNGIRLTATISLVSNQEVIRKEFGEVLFKENAVSGIATFILSSLIARSLVKNEMNHYKLVIDCVPSLSLLDLFNRFVNYQSVSPWKTLEQVMIGFIPKMVAYTLIREIDGMSISDKIGDTKERSLHRLAEKMKAFELLVEDLFGWQNSQTTSGGVTISEIHPRTLESRLIKHLLFAGEVIDIDGECGGFSLQWAWSSGCLAGLSASEIIKKMVG